jgi:hypothetical protein
MDISTHDLGAGERLVFNGSRQFNLLVGDGTGVTLALDGNPVKAFGNANQPANIEILSPH